MHNRTKGIIWPFYKAISFEWIVCKIKWIFLKVIAWQTQSYVSFLNECESLQHSNSDRKYVFQLFHGVWIQYTTRRVCSLRTRKDLGSKVVPVPWKWSEKLEILGFLNGMENMAWTIESQDRFISACSNKNKWTEDLISYVNWFLLRPVFI